MLYSIGEAAKLLNVNQATLRRWVDSGRIKCILSPGGQRKFEQSEIERVLGHSLEEIPRDTEPKQTEQEDPYRIKERRDEVKALNYEIEKHKTSDTLSGLIESKTPDPVKAAKDELEVLKIEKEKEKLLVEEKQKEHEQLMAKKRERFLKNCMGVAERHFSYFPGMEPEPIPLEWKVRLHKAVKETFEGVDLINEDLNQIALLIRDTADAVREEYCREVFWPQHKTEMIQDAISSLTFPMQLNSMAIKLLKGTIEKILNAEFTGVEDPEEVYDMAEALNKRVLDAVRNVQV